MNRQQRRNYAKGKISDKELKSILIAEAAEKSNQLRRKTVSLTIQNYSALIFLILHDKFGFGPKRLQRLEVETQELSDSINKGYLKISDILELLKNECGIDLTRVEGSANDRNN